jgi:tRNA pseudouridine38-40 synthase
VTLFGPDDRDVPAPGVGDQEEPVADLRPTGGSTGRSVRIRMTVAYDGSGFRGFAVQRGVSTVAGTLADALNAVIGHPVEITCAGRTDAGVHAIGQVIHFDLDPERAREAFASVTAQTVTPGTATPETAAIRRSLNRMLAPAIVVREAEVATAGFDARRSAMWRRYRYRVLNREDPDPFLARTAWHVEAPLELRSMQLSCDAVYGEHDFAAFCRQPPGPGTTVRRVTWAEWTAEGEILSFEIVATAFCHQMVRSLVGTMVDVGRGRKTAGDMAWIVRSGDRAKAGSPAPPHGLCLEEVGYPAQGGPRLPETSSARILEGRPERP